VAGGREDLVERGPQPERAVAAGQQRRRQSAITEIAQRAPAHDDALSR
jgi:hypothetical protein